MFTLKIGSLCSSLNHPYTFNNSNVKISGLAQMTPPVMVVTEILRPEGKFDQDSGIEKKTQLKCIFYSHKTSKYESSWFVCDQLKLIISQDFKILEDGLIRSENENNLIENGIKFLRDTNLKKIKSEYLNKLVVLKSCDIELGKKKITFEEEYDKVRKKTNAHLDFVPPVMTVIDIKLNEEKAKYDVKTGYQKKTVSNFLAKCKWFNYNSSTFSEDLLPIEILNIVTDNNSILSLINSAISENKLIKISNPPTLKMSTGLELTSSLIRPVELIFNHYKYILRYEDLYRSKYSQIQIDGLEVENRRDLKNIEEFVVGKIPRYNQLESNFTVPKMFDFVIGTFYRITYRDAQEKITKRIIYITDFIKDQVIVADCLLRDGELRHFKTSKESLLKIEELDQDFFQVSEQAKKSEKPNLDAD